MISICTHNGEKCLKKFVISRIGQKYCIPCTTDLGVKLEPIKGKSKYMYKNLKDIEGDY